MPYQFRFCSLTIDRQFGALWGSGTVWLGAVWGGVCDACRVTASALVAVEDAFAAPTSECALSDHRACSWPAALRQFEQMFGRAILATASSPQVHPNCRRCLQLPREFFFGGVQRAAEPSADFRGVMAAQALWGFAEFCEIQTGNCREFDFRRPIKSCISCDCAGNRCSEFARFHVPSEILTSAAPLKVGFGAIVPKPVFQKQHVFLFENVCQGSAARSPPTEGGFRRRKSAAQTAPTVPSGGPPSAGGTGGTTGGTGGTLNPIIKPHNSLRNLRPSPRRAPFLCDLPRLTISK